MGIANIRKDALLRLQCVGVARLIVGVISILMGLGCWLMGTFLSEWHYYSTLGAYTILIGFVGIVSGRSGTVPFIVLHCILSLAACIIMYPFTAILGAIELWCDLGSIHCNCVSVCPTEARREMIGLEVMALVLTTFLFMLNLLGTGSSFMAYRNIVRDRERTEAQRKAFPGAMHRDYSYQLDPNDAPCQLSTSNSNSSSNPRPYHQILTASSSTLTKSTEVITT